MDEKRLKAQEECRTGRWRLHQLRVLSPLLLHGHPRPHASPSLPLNCKASLLLFLFPSFPYPLCCSPMASRRSFTKGRFDRDVTGLGTKMQTLTPLPAACHSTPFMQPHWLLSCSALAKLFPTFGLGLRVCCFLCKKTALPSSSNQRLLLILTSDPTSPPHNLDHQFKVSICYSIITI